MAEFATTAEVDLNVHYENGPDGPEIVGIFTGEADSRLEYQLSRRDE